MKRKSHPEDERITRDELEQALRSFVDHTARDLKRAKTIGMGSAASIGAAAVAAAYAFGRKRGEKEDETYVEVQRVS